MLYEQDEEKIMAHGIWKNHPFVKKNNPNENFIHSVNLARSKMKSKSKIHKMKRKK